MMGHANEGLAQEPDVLHELDGIPSTLIIGCNGFLGAEFWRTYRDVSPAHIATSRKPRGPREHFLDLANPDVGDLPLGNSSPRQALVIAAISKINYCEEHKTESWQVNVEGTVSLVRQLHARGVKPIFFSTDAVFDGRRGGYSESDAPNPLIQYGLQKAETERRILAITGGNCLIIRLSKVYSTRHDGMFLDEMASALARGEAYAAAQDQVFTPTYVADVIRGVAFLQRIDATGIYHLCAPDAWSRYDVAVDISKALGNDEATTHALVKAISIGDLGVPRPKNTSMRNTKFQDAYRQSHGETMVFTSVKKSVNRVVRSYARRGTRKTAGTSSTEQ
jgi:dTDP-4-dehydrorhamnose reductase